jgi:PEP-CTERM motif
LVRATCQTSRPYHNWRRNTYRWRSYTFDLLFDNRIGGSDYINGYPVTQFYDTHTDGSFSTAGAVPEPSTWAMLLLGFVWLGVMIRRRTPADRVLAQ